MKIKQETFDTVASFLLKQGGPSANKIKCLYRGPNNTKCAAGCLIPDSEYQSEMDEQCKAKVTTNKLIKNVLIKEGYDINFVRELQIIHDENAENWKNWKNDMKQFAIENNLSYKVLEK